MVAIDFECLEGANPAKFGYFVALWQGNQIMSLSDAKEIQSINNTTQDGSFVFENLSIDNLDYTIGFGVDLKDSSTICSTLLIPKGTKLYDTLTSVPTTLELIEQSTNSLIAKFKAPLFTTPNMDKNWIALFEGQFTSNIYSGINLVKLIRVPNNTNKGEVVMNDIPGGLIVDQHYTLVYGMGTNNSQNNKTESAVAATVFRVPPRRN